MKCFTPFISLGVAAAMLIGCAHADLNMAKGNEVKQQKVKKVEVSEVSAEEKVADYFTQLRNMGKKGNFIYSPESMNSALCMYQYVTTKDSNKKVISDLIGNTDYLSYENNKKSFRLVNRIWKNKDKEVTFADEIKKYVYEMDMSDSEKATKEKNDYVSEKTNKFITSTPTKFNSDTIYDIMNVTYFKDTWKGGDLRKDKKNYNFTLSTGKKVKTKYLHYDKGTTYYENATAKAVEVPYKDGFSLLLIRPKKTLANVKFDDLLTSKKKADTVKVKFPEFETKSQMDLTEYFKNLGIENESLDSDITINQVARIKVDKKGTEAAAVSEIICGTTAFNPTQPKVVYVSMNKPFCYAILDTKNNDVAFVGQVTTIGK